MTIFNKKNQNPRCGGGTGHVVALFRPTLRGFSDGVWAIEGLAKQR
jgi:hypothetical protein